jgi:hypothetical protein
MAYRAARRLLAGLTIFFCVDGLQDVDLHRQVRHDALKPPVFLRQRPRLAQLINLHPAIVASRRLTPITPAGQPAAGCLAPLGCASIRSRSAR